MSIIEIKVPQLSESVSEATLVAWHKQVGEAVAEGENLIDIETDKVVLELPSFKSGVLTKILKNNGEKVVSEEVIALLDTEIQPSVQAVSKAVAEVQAQAAVMPAAQKIAAENKVDTASISGSGRDGRVLKEDVLSVQGKPVVPVVAAIPKTTDGERVEQRVPMTRIRQRIAERLLQSQQNAAILTTFNEVNMQQVIDLRNKYKDAFEKKHGIKLGFMSFFVKAAVLAR